VAAATLGGGELTHRPWQVALPSAGGMDGGGVDGGGDVVVAGRGGGSAWRRGAHVSAMAGGGAGRCGHRRHSGGVEAMHDVELSWCACFLCGRGWREQR